ncbi:13954_t:CDS:2, partial [Racocetra persica]
VKDFFENNSNSEIILKQEKIHASEYRAESEYLVAQFIIIVLLIYSFSGCYIARRIKNILNAFGISKDDFSKNGVQSIKILATLATILELRDVERSRILTNLRRNWDTKEDQKLREWKHNTTLLDQKAKEYQLKLSRLERQYDAMNIEGGGLRFQDLKNKEEQVDALEHLVKDKAKKLKTYQVLPP